MTSDFDALWGRRWRPRLGWRFPFLEERLVREPPSWDYVVEARSLLADATTALDHGTGGGEILSDIGIVPRLLFATEAYVPNAVAAEHLRPFKTRLVQVSSHTHNSRGPGTDRASALSTAPES